jgi:hypothetical protein
MNDELAVIWCALNASVRHEHQSIGEVMAAIARLVHQEKLDAKWRALEGDEAKVLFALRELGHKAQKPPKQKKPPTKRKRG